VSGVSEHFGIAGTVVQVDWPDEVVRSALRGSLAARAMPASAPDLVISVRRRPIVPMAGKGLVIDDDETGLTVTDAVHGIAQRIEANGSSAAFECPDGATLPVAERAAPFRLIFQQALRPRGIHLLHAGAVGLRGHGAVLLVAPGGGGKSNTVMACLNSPLQLLGEDFVAVDDTVAGRVWSLYNTAKLFAGDLARFPGLAASTVVDARENEGKAVLDLTRRHGDRWADGLPLRAILVLQITGEPESRIVSSEAAAAVKAMLTSLLMVVPSARKPLFEFVIRLAQRTPVHRLELGRDPRQLAATIHDFILRQSS